MSDIQIDDFDDTDADEVLAVINASFGFERSPAWFEWKHRDGPWGRSGGVVARDKRGLIGVRLLLPWRFRSPSGETVTAQRAVEAATVPRAMGKGVFSQLNRELMRRAAQQGGATFLFSTPNEQSRTGYRKLGWSWLDPVPHVWRPALPSLRPGRPYRSRSRLNGLEITSDGAGRITTHWSATSLAWRLDPRTGHDYEVMIDAQDRAGLAYRLARARVRTLLPVHAWGDQHARARLIRAAVRRERVVLVLDTAEPGGAPVSQVPGRRRGGSLLAVWRAPGLPRASWPLDATAAWRLGFADLENVL